MIKDGSNKMIACVLINNNESTYCMTTNMCSIFSYLRDNPNAKIIYNNVQCTIQILNNQEQAIIEFEPEFNDW